MAELDGSLDLKSKYIYTNGMLVGRIDSSGELYQYFHDGLGSITMITDTTGSYQNLYTYDDFGNFRSKTENVSNSYCYTGQERDEEPSGLYNLRARYYAAGIGRFTQEDPIMPLSVHLDALFGTDPVAMFLFGMAQPQGLHGYVYVRNNPISWIDPWGLVRKHWSQKLYEGRYYGTGGGEYSTEKYAQWFVDYGDWWYALGGGFSALWTPETWRATAWTLATAGSLNNVDWANVSCYRLKVKMDPAHHRFKWLGNQKLRHIQLIIWKKAIKGSHIIKRIPLPFK